MDTFDVVIAGSGPAGLSAALILGRARKRVLLLDAGPRRNAAARHVQGFLTRDGTPPQEMRNVARAQLAAYDTVEVRDERVAMIDGERGAFRVRIEGRADCVVARRVMLCTGVVDELPSVPGLKELWGTAVFACPYCHAFEVKGAPFAALFASPAFVDYPILMRAWTDDVVALTNGAFAVPDDARARLASAGVKLEERPLRRLVGGANGLEAIELADGTLLPRKVLFTRTPQKQVELVRALDVALDDNGYVKVDEQMRTSRAGIIAAGDLTTMGQSAILAAGAGAKAAYALNHELTIEAATSRA